jgi:hypothetical protein
MTRSTVAMCAALLLMSAGCEPPESIGNYGPQEIDAGNFNGEDAGAVEANFSNMTGTWALSADFSSCVRIFELEETRNRTITKVEIVQEGLRLTETHIDCESSNTPIANLEAVVPTSTVNVANPMLVESVVLGTDVGKTYRSRLKTRLWGIRMDDPLADPFPTTTSLPDERIFDADEDGNPGVTLTLGDGFCDIFIVQRALESLQGTLQADGSIAGGGSLLTLQAIIDATSPFCSTEYDLVPNDAHSAFRMVRIDAEGLNFDADGDGEVSCAEILARKDDVLIFDTPDVTRCEPPEEGTDTP